MVQFSPLISESRGRKSGVHVPLETMRGSPAIGLSVERVGGAVLVGADEIAGVAAVSADVGAGGGFAPTLKNVERRISIVRDVSFRNKPESALHRDRRLEKSVEECRGHCQSPQCSSPLGCR